ncbi:unnamed protein product [Penicillium olsonii]|nr:unnamed protein product [Penicillium olsonii]
MVNPPEISPPRETPTATLASVDISLEYCFYEEDIPQPSHTLVSELVFNQGDSSSVSPFNLELEPQEMAEPRLPGTDCDFVWLEETLHEALPHHIEPQIHHTPTVEPSTSHGALQRLFELGMERLMTSKRPRNSDIYILEGASLASLAEIAPVVFKPEYREAINQRGVAMPIINKAISIMLQGSQSISLHTKLTHSISESSDYPIMRPHGVDSQATNLKTAIHSKLWDIAQQNTSKLKTLTRSSFLLPKNLNRMTHKTGDDIPPMLMSQGFDDMLPGTFIDRQVNSIEGEEKTLASFLSDPHSRGESEDHLLDNNSETSFTDICDSTQSSLDTLFSAAASSQTVLSDDDNMLLSDYRDPSCEEAYVTYPYPLGNIQTGDEDLIMTDEV